MIPAGRRKHSMTSFYIKTVHHQPSPLRLIAKDDQIQVESLQNMVRMQQKEIERLEHQNRNLMVLVQHQTGMIQQERQVRTRSIKSLAEFPNPGEAHPDKTPTIRLRQETEQKPKIFLRKGGVSRRLTVLFQKEESYKLSSILSDSISDQEAIKLYENDGSIQLINEALNDEDSFLDIIQNYPPQKVSIVYDKLKKIFSEHATMFHMILKLKTALLNSFTISKCKILDEAFSCVTKEALDILECNKVQFYQIDEEKKQLFTKSSNIRYNIGDGIVGYVAQNKEILNLKNARYDTRFAADNMNIVLAAPILENGKCLGVMLCQDKLNGQFDDDDEALLELLNKQVRVILNNVLGNEQLVVQINKFRHTLKSTLLFIENIGNQDKLMQIATQRLRELMSSDQAQIKLFTEFQQQGIMGQSIIQKRIVTVPNSYNSTFFHPNYDIKTSLPVIALPIIVNDQNIGAAEVPLIRGALQSSSISSIEQEVLELFMHHLGQCLLIS